MKKYAKILSILLCLSMLVGMIAMVVTAEETTEPEASTVLESVDPTRLTSVIGKYTDGTGADESTFVVSGNGEALTDGDSNTYGMADFTYEDSQAEGSLAAIIIDIDGTIKLTGIEIDPYEYINQWNVLEGKGDITTFTIQALVDGEWVDLVSKEGFLFGEARYAEFEFDAVETNKVRILVPLYYDNQLYVSEIILIEEKPVEPEQPTEPEVPTEPEEMPMLKAEYGKLPLPKYGYYTADGGYVPGGEEWYVVNGWLGQSAEINDIPDDATPVVEFDFSEAPMTLGGWEITSYNYTNSISSLKIEAITTEGGEWETVYTNESTFTDSLTLRAVFEKVITAYGLRVVVLAHDSSSVHLTEVAPLIPVEADLVPVVPNSAELIVLKGAEIGWEYGDLVAELFDGDLTAVACGTASDHWAYWNDSYQQYGVTTPISTPILTMDLTKDGKPSAVSELTLYSFRGGQRHTPKSLIVEAQLVAGGEWVALKEVVNHEWFFEDEQGEDRSAPMYVAFDAVAAYALRVVVTANTGAKGECGWYIPEIELAGPADFEIPEVPVDPEQPTDPSEPEGTEPEGTEPEATEPEVTEPELVLDPARLGFGVLPAPIFGYYADNGELVEFTRGNYVSANITDGSLFSLGCSDKYVPGELLQNGGTKHPVVYFDMSDAPVTLNGLQYITNWNENCFATDLYIQVTTSADGEWETVFEASGLNFNENELKNFRFETVTAYKLRIMITAFQYPETPDQQNNLGVIAIQEIIPWVVTDDRDLVQVPIYSVTGGIYDDGMEWKNLTGGFMASCVNDGLMQNYDTIGGENDSWIFDAAQQSGNGGAYTPAFLLYFEEPQVMTRIEVYPQRGVTGPYFASYIIVQAEDADGNWNTIAEGTTADWTGIAVFEFDAVETQQIRILGVVVPRVGTEAAHFRVNEIIAYTEEGAVPGESTEDPTEPSDPEATEPEATEPEATEPEATDPEATEPEATEPEATEPEATEPEATEPEATEPEATEPDNDPSGKTGDITLSVLVGLLAISAIGCGIVISKKKEF